MKLFGLKLYKWGIILIIAIIFAFVWGDVSPTTAHKILPLLFGSWLYFVLRIKEE